MDTTCQFGRFCIELRDGAAKLFNNVKADTEHPDLRSACGDCYFPDDGFVLALRSEPLGVS